MKNLTRKTTILFIFTVIVSACTVNNNNNPNNNTFPDLSLISANPNHDNSYFGVYKGIIGDSISTGNILIDFGNSQTEAKAYFRFKGNQYILTQSDIVTVGNTITVTVQNSDITLKLSVNNNGNSPTISYFSFNGLQGYGINIMKQTSTNVVKCYEGTYNSDTSSCGVFRNTPLGLIINGSSAYILLYIKTYNGVGSGYYYFLANYDIYNQKISLTALDAPITGTAYKLYAFINGDIINNNMNGIYRLYVGTSIYTPICNSEGDWIATKTL